MGHCWVGPVRIFNRGSRAYVFRQSKGNLGDGMRSSSFEFQKPGHGCSCEKEHQTHIRWFFLPLCRRAEAWVGKGIQEQETDQLCEVAVLLYKLYIVQQPCLVFVYCIGLLLLPDVQQSRLGQPLFSMRWLRIQQDEQLYIVPELWEDLCVGG